jgi:hypothetical protein
MGVPPGMKSQEVALKSVGAIGEPGEVKHLSNRRKRNQTRFPE